MATIRLDLIPVRNSKEDLPGPMPGPVATTNVGPGQKEQKDPSPEKETREVGIRTGIGRGTSQWQMKEGYYGHTRPRVIEMTKRWDQRR